MHETFSTMHAVYVQHYNSPGVFDRSILYFCRRQLGFLKDLIIQWLSTKLLNYSYRDLRVMHAHIGDPIASGKFSQKAMSLQSFMDMYDCAHYTLYTIHSCRLNFRG
jgi:hypothetical protein